ncbi:HD domain-containing protein [Crocosphaera sp. XPORK-15E]|uniref:HD domain-containing protein n=1 Tax=Crocosphaera sp. XPORK-15E TaxID=3110247 RepID=UPI002B220790|nr:HD domain-containing protein [Crocosphaera sp. XPORK-15E]MEA5537328.1 HD domain-containing protein [Crocosphaera sp. XPORK-15E]
MMLQSSLLTPRFEQAFVYVAQLHRYQCRKGKNIPYLSHLLSVCALVLEAGGDEDEAIAALLHDAIEDQGGQKIRLEIRDKFGDRVCQIVDECTDTDQSPKPPWKARKLQYIKHFRTASLSGQRVSLADKLHNARSTLRDKQEIGDEIWTLFKGGKEGTLWFYHEIIHAAVETESSYSNSEKPFGFLLEELEQVVRQLEN